MTTLLRDLIDIPTQVHQGDFVLKLTEGVSRPEQTLYQYVVTEQLATCFDSALGLIHSAIEDRSSKAAYLHGSFGSGKSHFMAVLTLLLEGYPAVRQRPDLAPVIERHDGWMRGRKFLVVPYHLIGATSMEQAILGGYARFVRERHPDAPAPAVYISAPIFANARQLRDQLGDESFFANLKGAAEAEGGGWGALDAGWDAARFEAAIDAPPGDEEHDALLSALLRTMFTAYQGVVSESGFVTLDEGLSAISRHAKDLGYDALILFLDELILWLASRMADRDFVSSEGQKVAKLVEAQVAERPVPVVSFVARQRDLRELVGENVPGAEQLGFADVLRWWEGRFSTITLEDRNLPEIAERRVLRPRSDDARQQIDDAFRETEQVGADVWRTLLTSDADRDLFRKTYPFSPAFVKALVAVSSALQRERTALKVMVQLLSDNRDELALGDLVPVGDLFDVIAAGDEPSTEAMRQQFDAARRLYATKLRPLLLSTHGLDDDAARALLRTHPFRTDDRLVKTLLLAALVPEVEPLRSLTAGRLAALNHGTITSPIPGEERTIVLQRARDWASQVAEIKVSEDNDPVISVQLVGVDTESILDQARQFDNDGERRRRVRTMVLEGLGVANADTLMLEYRTLWRGTPRALDLSFGNLRSNRDVPDAALAADGDRWRLIVDFPFDEAGHGGADDRARLEDYRANNPSTRTVCWIPTHFSPQLERDLGRLVVLEHVLSGERFPTFASHMAPADQAVAKAMLDGQRLNLVQRVGQAVEQAYGIAHPREGMVDTEVSQDEIFVSLQTGFTPQPPVAANLREGADALAAQMLAHQFPAHPDFGDGEIKQRDAESVYEEVARAARAEDGRVLVTDTGLRRLLLRVANPLTLGVMHEAYFQLDDRWVQHIERQAAAAKQRGEEGPLTVGRIRGWLDVPQPMGIPRHLQDLVIMVFADQTNRSFTTHGGPARVRIGGLDDQLELVEHELPSQDEWERAGERASAIFGIPPRPLLNAANVRELAVQLTERVESHRAGAADVRRRLESHAQQLGLEDTADRLRTSRAADDLLARLAGASGSAVEAVQALATADVPTTEQALGKSIAQSQQVASALSGVQWKLIDALDGVQGADAESARQAKGALALAACADEFVTPLAEVLRDAEGQAIAILTLTTPPLTHDTRRIHHQDVSLPEAQRLLADLAKRDNHGEGVKVTVSWTEPLQPE